MTPAPAAPFRAGRITDVKRTQAARWIVRKRKQNHASDPDSAELTDPVQVPDGFLADSEPPREALAGLCTRFDPVSIGCDQYGLEQLQQELSEIGAGLPCVVHPQGFNRRVIDKKDFDEVETGAEEIALWMPDSINKLEAALLEQRIAIDPNPVMDMCASGVVYEQNRTGHRMFAKDKATSRIDGMVSLAMSIGVATISPTDTRSVYNSRDLLVF